MPRVKLFDQEQVLKKAVHLFWKKGYNATSMQDLVDYLGINRGSLYDTFGGKEALFNKAFDTYLEEGANGIQTFFNRFENVKDGISAFFENIINESCSDAECKGCFVVNTTAEMASHDSVINEKVNKHQIVVENTFSEYIKMGQSKGQLASKIDSDILAKVLYTYLMGMRLNAKMNTDKGIELKSLNNLLLLLV